MKKRKKLPYTYQKQPLKDPPWNTYLIAIQRLGSLTQKDIEELTGVKQYTISRLLSVKRAHPTYRVGHAIMALYKEVNGM